MSDGLEVFNCVYEDHCKIVKDTYIKAIDDVADRFLEADYIHYNLMAILNILKEIKERVNNE